MKDYCDSLDRSTSSVEHTLKDGPEIDRPDNPVSELDAEAVRPGDLERLDPVDGVSHAPLLLPQRLNLAWKSAGL